MAKSKDQKRAAAYRSDAAASTDASAAAAAQGKEKKQRLADIEPLEEILAVDINAVSTECGYCLSQIKKPKAGLYHCSKVDCTEKHETYIAGYSYDTEPVVQTRIKSQKPFKKFFDEYTLTRQGKLDKNWQRV